MNKKIIVLNLLIVLFFVSINSISKAQDLNEIQEQKNEIENKIAQENEQVEQIQIELTDNLEQLNSLNEKIYTYNEQIENLNLEIVKKEEQIKNITDKLNKLQENYNAQKEILQNRIVALYEVGDIVYLDVLLSSNSLYEFILNYYYIGEIARYDNDLLENIEQEKVKIEEIKNSYEREKEDLQKKKKQQEKLSISVENAGIIKNSYINKLTNEEKQIQEKINKYQEELNKLETQILAITSIETESGYVGGEFAWPVPGYTTITSPYGYRVHPILKVVRLHSGTDIRSTYGSIYNCCK